MEVPRTLTPLTQLDVAIALRSAYVEIFGEDPTSEVLGVGWAQVALENAHGRAVYNYNFGNITGAGEGGDFYTLTTDEQVQPAVWKSLKLNYAAHPDATAGARAYWKLITGRYRAAFDEFFTTGRAHDAAIKLHELGYFTANPGPIAVTFGNLYQQFADEIGPSLGGLAHADPKAEECPPTSRVS